MSRPELLSQPESVDGGFSLTELLVVITLMGVIGLIVGMAIITGLHKQTQVQDRSDALAHARTALQRADRDIRASNPLICATADQVVVREVGTTTKTLTYSIVAQSATRNELVVDAAAPSSCGGTVTATSRVVLLRDLVNTTTNPVFNFAPWPGYSAASTVNASTCAVSGTSPVAYDPTCIGTVTVNVQVQPTTLVQPVVLSDNGVDLRNTA